MVSGTEQGPVTVASSLGTTSVQRGAGAALARLDGLAFRSSCRSNCGVIRVYGVRGVCEFKDPGNGVSTAESITFWKGKTEDSVIILGIILLIIGLLTGLSILWTIGCILVVIGLVLWVLGAVGHAVGGRRHYW